MDYNDDVKQWEEFKIGDVARFAKTVTDSDVVVWWPNR